MGDWGTPTHIRRSASMFSIVFAVLSGIVFLITAKSDFAIINLLVAIWFKLPYPDESK